MPGGVAGVGGETRRPYADSAGEGGPRANARAGGGVDGGGAQKS